MRKSSHWQRAVATMMVATVMVVVGAGAAVAAPHSNLAPISVPFYSQLDPHWGSVLVGAHEDVPMRKRGALLTCIAMVAASRNLLPKFFVPGSDVTLLPTPDYIHAYLKEFGGYQTSPSEAVIVDYDALQFAFLDVLSRDAGLDFIPYGWPAIAAGTDRALERGLPTIFYVQRRPGQFHPVVVIGWDEATESYLVLDPARLRWDGTPQSLRVLLGAEWQREVSGGLIPLLRTATELPDPVPLLDVDADDDDQIVPAPLSVSTKSPVEVTVIDPRGRRVGWDPVAATTVVDVPGASYLQQPVWDDPVGSLAPLPPGRVLTIPRPLAGRYRFEMIATGDGPYTLNVRVHDATGARTVEERKIGTVQTGDVVKFQVEYARRGPSYSTFGDNFSPEARAGGPRRVVAGDAVAFDAGKSFDVDGTIVSYAWDFGDGAIATGLEPAHAYAAPGTYTATLTITDDHGAVGTDTAAIAVFGDQPVAGTTERVSVGPHGEEGTGSSPDGAYLPAMSGDGSIVAFASNQNGLGVPGGALYVRDRRAGTTVPVTSSVCGGGGGGGIGGYPAVSRDGRFVAYECNFGASPTSTGIGAIVVHDLATGFEERVDVSSDEVGGTCPPTSSGSCASFRPAISADGRYVAFYSNQTNLVAGDTNDGVDVFVRDRMTGTTERVNVAADGGQSHDAVSVTRDPRLGISGDGRFVAFESYGTDLVAGTPFFPARRVYVRDRVAGTTEVASVPTGGAPASAAQATSPSISADGRYVVFVSFETTLVAGDTNGFEDVFVRDRVAGTTVRASLSGAGEQAACPPFVTLSECTRDPVISADGRFVAFRSRATNLALSDTNNREDVFVRDLVANATELASVATDGTQGNGNSGEAHFTNDETRIAVSADGRFVAFTSDATNLVFGDANGLEDVFVRDLRPPGLFADPSGPYLGFASAGAPTASITFDAHRSFDPAGNALAAAWDFGDGTAVVTELVDTPVAHAYAAPGRYVVTLTVTDGVTTSAPATTVADVEPWVAPGLALHPACGAPGSRLVASIEGIPLVPVAGGWNLAAGPVPSVRTVHPADTTQVSITAPGGAIGQPDLPIGAFTHLSPLALAMRVDVPIDAGAAPGTYTLGAAEAGGLVATFTVPCPPLANEVPHAAVGGPYTGEVGEAIAFDGAASSDPESAGLGYHWYFEDGVELAGVQPTRTFDAPGTYLVELVVNDGALDSPSSAGTGSYTTVTIGGGDPCTAAPRAATFASIQCRLEALRARTAALAVGAKLVKRLRTPLDGALKQLAETRTFCAVPKLRRAKSKLGRTARKIAQFGRRFRVRAVKKVLTDQVRNDFVQSAEPIRLDAVALRGVLQCPAEAGGS